MGTALHAHALDHAAAKGAKRMALDTAAPATGLIRMYRSWGYTECGSCDWRPHTNYVSTLMVRPVGEAARHVAEHFLRHTPADPHALPGRIAMERQTLDEASRRGDPKQILDCAGTLVALLTAARREADAFAIAVDYAALARANPSLEEAAWLLHHMATAAQYCAPDKRVMVKALPDECSTPKPGCLRACGAADASRLFSGTGPGVQSADGCSVELYRRLPYMNELAPVRAFLRDGATVLELGCGTGRITRTLAAWGLVPTAVDESQEMLAHLPAGVAAVCSRIETLQLPQRFDVVLLASCLVNHPDHDTRTSFLACAARHLRPSGRLLLERHDPAWLARVASGPAGGFGSLKIFAENVARSEGQVRMRLRYELDDQAWWHEFSAAPLTEREIEFRLSAHGFANTSWHGSNRRWAAAVFEGNAVGS